MLDQKYVFVVDEHNVVKSRKITTGTEMPHMYVVTEGLNENDKILVEGLRKVKNNDTIKYEFEHQNKIIAELEHLHAE